MNVMDAEMFEYYDREMVKLISRKYGYEHMHALREFLKSETRVMLEDPEQAMWEFSPLALFDIWEAEKVTGDPRNSVYIRCD